MADNKSGRDDQADDAERRQRERALAAELERGDEPEPPADASELAEFEQELDRLEFPVQGAEIVAAVGDRGIGAAGETYTVEELVPETDVETFDSPSAVRSRVQRPTVAAAMKRVVEASQRLPNVDFPGSQREGYERTFRELEAVDEEAIPTVADWIVERIHDKDTLPGTRGVRRQAAKVCRANGHEIRNDEWLGV